jgi:hypothetical protein
MDFKIKTLKDKEGKMKKLAKMLISRSLVIVGISAIASILTDWAYMHNNCG